MIKAIYSLLIILFFLFNNGSIFADNAYKEQEQRQLESWLQKHLLKRSEPFFSFIYNNQNSANFLRQWKSGLDKEQRDKNRTRYTLTYNDPKTNLVVRCRATIYKDFPAVEWLLEFENSGKSDTPIIENILPADVRLLTGDHEKYILHHALGSNHGINDFMPLKDEIKSDSKIILAPKGGRSSDETALPFFNIQAENNGIIAAVGWTGQWQVVIKRDKKTGITLRAGMEKTHLKLHPGEKIRSPRILLLFWQGQERFRGHNLLRRYILAHHTPLEKGKPLNGPFACNGGAFMFNEFTMATECNMIALA